MTVEAEVVSTATACFLLGFGVGATVVNIGWIVFREIMWRKR